MDLLLYKIKLGLIDLGYIKGIPQMTFFGSQFNVDKLLLLLITLISMFSASMQCNIKNWWILGSFIIFWMYLLQTINYTRMFNENDFWLHLSICSQHHYHGSGIVAVFYQLHNCWIIQYWKTIFKARTLCWLHLSICS